MNSRNLRWIVPVVAVLLAVACMNTDAGISTKLRAKLAVDDTVRPYKIEVATQDGVVTLTGNIDSEAAKQRALSIAMRTGGVVEVKDMIEVRRASGGGDAPDPGRTIGVTIDDAGTTMRVKGRLLEDPVVNALRIDVDTRDGVVFLTGSVRSEQERKQAVKLARETKGVRDVQANLTIENG
jgi:hyperosmotically inducible periplasmic protein